MTGERGENNRVSSVEPDRLLAEADALYAAPLTGFTAARDARAKQLRPEDRPLADAVKALRKPTVAAWVVNLLVRRAPEQATQLLEVGAALRAAQAGLDAEQLRALTRERRQVTTAVAGRAAALAREQGHNVTQPVRDQVEATLTAAMLDEGAAAAVRSGLLAAPLAATGVDPVDAGAAVAVPAAMGATATPMAQGADAAGPNERLQLHVVPDPDAEAKALRAAEEALAETEQALATATAEHDEATSEVSDREARSLQATAELDELRRRVAEAEQRLEQVEDELADAEDIAAEATDAVTSATEERDRAAAALDRLRD